MRKFSFRLEPLFEYRKRLEEIGRKDLAAALARLAEEEQRLDEMKAMCAAASGELDAMKERGGQPREYAGHYDYLSGLNERIKKQERALKSAAEAFEAERARYTEASKAKKVVETMRDRALDAYEAAASREEQKLGDDVTSARFAASRRKAG